MESEARPTDAALNAVLDVLAKDPSPYVREGVMKRLTDSRFKRLPKDFAAIGLKLAKKPENLNDDPLGYIRVHGAALEMLGKTDAPDGLALPDVANHPYFLTVRIDRDMDVEVAARLAPGVTLAQAQGALAAVLANSGSEFLRNPDGPARADVRPWREQFSAGHLQPLLLVQASALLLLLMAATHLAGLSLDRALARQGDQAVLRALGAGTRVTRLLSELAAQRYFVDVTARGAWRLHDLLRDALLRCNQRFFVFRICPSSEIS